MPWFIVSYDVSPDTAQSDETLEGDALRWGWDKYKKLGRTFRRLPKRTLVGEFQDFSAAASNFAEIRNRVKSGDQLMLSNVIVLEISDFGLFP